jgi:hypothetical protein
MLLIWLQKSKWKANLDISLCFVTHSHSLDKNNVLSAANNDMNVMLLRTGLKENFTCWLRQ